MKTETISNAHTGPGNIECHSYFVNGIAMALPWRFYEM